MKIYNTWAKDKTNTTLVRPGHHHPETSSFMEPGMDANGKAFSKPRTYLVKFVKGVAEVDDSLGSYMIKFGLAHKRPQPEVSGVHNTFILAADVPEPILAGMLR